MAKQATIERSGVLDKAARCMSRGELDAALRLYLQIFDNDPHDWSVGNTLGDLYIRMGRTDEAVSHFTMLAEQLMSDGFAAKARALYRKIVRLQPGNEDASRRVAELERQQIGETSPFLKRVLETARTMRETHAVETAAAPHAADTAPAPPASAAIAEPVEIPAAPVEIPAAPPAPEPAAAPFVDESAFIEESLQAALEAAEPADDEAADFARMDDAACSAAARGDYRAAAGIIERFLSAHPRHVAALERLVDTGVDGGLASELTSAQQRLADACAAAGQYRQAFDVASDLVAREPDDPGHRAQLARIVDLARAHGPAFDMPSAEPPEAKAEPALIAPPARPQSAPLPPPVSLPPAKPVPAQVASRSETPPSRPVAVGPPFGDLLKDWSDPERLLDDIRSALLEDAAAAAEEAFTQGARLVDARQYGEARRPLEEAMTLPHLRVAAGARLSQLYRGTGAPAEAMAVLEWVAEMPPSDEDAGHELAYELALTLEALGQQAQALGVYRELLAEAGPNYRDIATRAKRLAAA